MHLPLELLYVFLCQTACFICCIAIPGEPDQVCRTIDAGLLEICLDAHETKSLPADGTPNVTMTARIAPDYQ